MRSTTSRVVTDSGIRHIIDPERDVLLPAKHAGLHELLQLRDRVGGVEEHRVAHELGKIIAGMLEVIEGNAHTPDVNVRIGGEDFFPEGLGSAVKGTVVLAKGEIGSVLFGKPGTIRSRSRIDATRRDMTPRHVGGVTGLGDDPWQDGIAGEAFGSVNLARIDIGLSGVTGRINEEIGLFGTQRCSQLGEIRVVEIRATQTAESNATAFEVFGVRISNIAGTT